MGNIYCLSNYQHHPASWTDWYLSSHKKVNAQLVGLTAEVRFKGSSQNCPHTKSWLFIRPPSPSDTKRLRPLKNKMELMSVTFFMMLRAPHCHTFLQSQPSDSDKWACLADYISMDLRTTQHPFYCCPHHSCCHGMSWQMRWSCGDRRHPAH
jgi:hypothetical protein